MIENFSLNLNFSYLANKIGLQRLISGRPKKWQEKGFKNWSAGSPDLSCLDYFFWAHLKRRTRDLYNQKILRTKEEFTDFVENKYADECDQELLDKSIMGTKIGDEYVGGYKSRLLAVLETGGANLTTLTRKQRHELKCLPISELKKLSIDGDCFEDEDDDDDVEPDSEEES